ncbi:hypothetical protein VHA01S_057_00170 [Vibrio halioticoli NBRC 102217]|uniref:DUF4397 domain-containing protein n=1 Tax=Vibrio halioticoli NBRC 102217 TaxID=1219072 RepID=V5FMH6_9VIBR|nr:DUF4397 domain-containing protein [Vibrio halioticoli]GAD90831.1 hypothetical protein VHA01S_057_00170 [Vibrio halioticoli NBRC 102217]
MFKNYLPVMLVASSLFIVGCNDDDEPSAQARVQAVHASADAPLANVTINGDDASSTNSTFNSQTLSGVDYATASGYIALDEGENSIQVDVQLPGGEVATVIPNTVLNLDSSLLYTVMVVGQADASSEFAVEPLIIARSATGDNDATNVDVQVVHASPGVPEVDVHVTGPNDDINPGAPLATLSYKASTGVVSVPAAEYRVRLALAGTSTVAFDSGAVALPAGAELTIAAIPNVNAAKDENTVLSPVKLLVMDGTGSSIIHDTNEITQVRVGHLSADTPTVDVSVDGTVPVDLTNVDFKVVSGYLDLAAKAYDLGIFAFDDPTNLQIDAQGVEFEKGKDYSVYAINELANIDALVIEDKRRPVATSATLSVLHAASLPAAATVDIYLTTSTDISNSDPALASFAYTDIVQNVYVAAGSYVVTVTGVGSKDALLQLEGVMLENGKVYKAIATNEGILAADITE